MQPPIVFIPCKLLKESKSRLSRVLTAAARYDLCVRLLDHTIQTAKMITPAPRVFLITGDEVALGRARHQSISVIEDLGSLNDALTAARNSISRIEALDGPLVVLPIDLVGVSDVALRNSITALDVTIVPDSMRSGTNLLVLRGDAARSFRFNFGPNSFSRHYQTAFNANYSISVLDDPVLAFDLDSDRDYWQAGKMGYLDALEMAS